MVFGVAFAYVLRDYSTGKFQVDLECTPEEIENDLKKEQKALEVNSETSFNETIEVLTNKYKEVIHLSGTPVNLGGVPAKENPKELIDKRAEVLVENIPSLAAFKSSSKYEDMSMDELKVNLDLIKKAIFNKVDNQPDKPQTKFEPVVLTYSEVLAKVEKPKKKSKKPSKKKK